MKKIFIISYLISSMVIFSNEVLYTEDVVRLLLENNSSIKIVETNSKLALAIYNQITGAFKPNISFKTNTITSPLVGYNNYIPDVDTYNLTGGLNYSQLLNTGGSLNINIYDKFTISDQDSGIEINQNPGVSITYYQPIFVKDKFIDIGYKKKSNRVGEISYIISQIEEIETKNQIILGVLSSIHGLNSLKGNVEVLERNILFLEKDIDVANEQRSAGVISSNELVSKELDLARLKETLFDLNYQISVLETNLGRLLGLKSINNKEFDLQFNYRENSLPPVGLSERKALLQLEQNKEKSSQNRVAESPVLSFSLLSEGSDLNSGEDVEFSLDLKLGFEFSFYDGEISKNKREADSILVDLTAENLKELQSVQLENINKLAQKRELLEKKKELLKENISFDNSILVREKELLELGSSTPQSIELIEIDILSKENELKILSGEEFLDKLQLLDLLGINIEEIFKQR